MKKPRKISRRFQPDECSYKIGWFEVFEKPKGAVVRYWIKDRYGNYFGILRFRVNIFQTVALLIILYALYVFFFSVGSKSVSITNTNVLYLQNGSLALNMNNNSLEGDAVKYNIDCKGTTIQSGELSSGSSIGTVKSNLSMEAGDYPAVITYTIPGEHKDIVRKTNVLLKVQ